ncbi:MAG TPA: hypothetical protein VN213_10835 [Solirubrobacteraceae bacterium]|nr:hypothetical protein [Solirubrobacteraceae bacterium]
MPVGVEVARDFVRDDREQLLRRVPARDQRGDAPHGVLLRQAQAQGERRLVVLGRERGGRDHRLDELVVQRRVVQERDPRGHACEPRP